MMLAQLALNQLRVGDRLVSARGNSGAITAIVVGDRADVDPEDVHIEMAWSVDGTTQTSYQPHVWLNDVQHLGTPTPP